MCYFARADTLVGMTVAAHDPRPKKVQIADALREEISAMGFPEGHRLAPLRELAQRFGTPLDGSRPLR